MASRKSQPMTAQLARPAVDAGFPVWFVDLLLHVLPVDEHALTPTTKILDDLDGEPLDVMELAMGIEHETTVPPVPDYVLERWQHATLTQILADVKRALDRGAWPEER